MSPLNIILVVVVLLLLFGGIGTLGNPLYAPYSYGGISLGGVLLLVLLVMLATGRL